LGDRHLEQAALFRAADLHLAFAEWVPAAAPVALGRELL
jgi:hypothetical protein